MCSLDRSTSLKYLKHHKMILCCQIFWFNISVSIFFPALLYSSQNHSRQASSFSSFLPFIVFAFFFYIILFIYFWLCWVFVAVSRRYSLVAVRGLLHCSGFSCCGAQTLGRVGFSSCSTRAQYLWLWNSKARASSCGSWA